MNELGQVTECCIGNVVAKVDGKCVTPPVSCGLLAGTFRDLLLTQGVIKEGILTVSDLHCAEGVYMINSVREWVRLIMVD
jgi:para-aminobenzoate synthetase/4-amino-4-deoxychorismate lyase